MQVRQVPRLATIYTSILSPSTQGIVKARAMSSGAPATLGVASAERAEELRTSLDEIRDRARRAVSRGLRLDMRTWLLCVWTEAEKLQ